MRWLIKRKTEKTKAELLHKQILRRTALFVIGAFVGGATTPADTVDVIDGSVIVTPGTAVVLQGVATAGTSPLVNFGFTWEEIPV